MDDGWGIVVAAALLTGIIAALVVGAITLPFIALGGGIFAAIYMHFHSPRYLEQRASEYIADLYAKARRLHQPISREEFVGGVLRGLPPAPSAITASLAELLGELYDMENLDAVPAPPAIANSIEGARYRDKLSAMLAKTTNPRNIAAAVEELSTGFSRVIRWLPAPPPDGDLLGAVPLKSTLESPGQIVDALCGAFYAYPIVETGLFRLLRERLDIALATHKVSPPEYLGEDVVAAYVGGTPLYEFFETPVPIRIPPQTRFEHMHLVAGTGHGKTQTLQYLIAQQLRSDAALVIIDSQNTLIDNIAHLDIPFDRLVLIDPTDIEYPPALNLFDIGMDRINALSPLDRERMTNQVIELYDFVLGALLGAELTSKQSVVFRYITRLMLHIPDATIHTLVDLMRPGATAKYAADIAKMTGTAREFFDHEFDGQQFRQTKEEVLRRLYGILENGTFNRIMSHPRNKVDFFAAMEQGKIILVNTARDLLMGEGTKIFGRFIIALLRQAVQQRATRSHNTPAFIYIDEFSDYLSGSSEESVEQMLIQARKQNVGLVLSHQHYGQLSPKLQQTIASNTSMRLVGGVSPHDARTLAAQLHTTPEFIQAQRSAGQFAAYIKGVTDTAVSIRMPFGIMEQLPLTDDFDGLRDEMRRRYASPAKFDSEGPPMEDARDLPPSATSSRPAEERDASPPPVSIDASDRL